MSKIIGAAYKLKDLHRGDFIYYKDPDDDSGYQYLGVVVKEDKIAWFDGDLTPMADWSNDAEFVYLGGLPTTMDEV